MKKILILIILSISVPQFSYSNANFENMDDIAKYYREKDYSKAAETLKNAYNSGKTIPVFMLADLYYYDLKDYDSALEWYKIAAEKGGNDMAKHKIAEIYSKLGNNTASAEWHQKAADSGNVRSMYKLSDMKEKGIGVEANPKDAFDLMNRVAQKGHLEAMYKVGVFYANGKGCEKNVSQAMQWYKKAAGKGHIQSMLDIGDIYYYGKGVKKSSAQAFVWYKKAEANGKKDLSSKINGIKKILPSGICNAVKSFTTDSSYLPRGEKKSLDNAITNHITGICDSIKNQLEKKYGEDYFFKEEALDIARKACDLHEQGSFAYGSSSDYVYKCWRETKFYNETEKSMKTVVYSYKVDINSMTISPYGNNSNESCKMLSKSAYSKASKTGKWQQDCSLPINLSGF